MTLQIHRVLRNHEHSRAPHYPRPGGLTRRAQCRRVLNKRFTCDSQTRAAEQRRADWTTMRVCLWADSARVDNSSSPCVKGANDMPRPLWKGAISFGMVASRSSSIPRPKKKTSISTCCTTKTCRASSRSSSAPKRTSRSTNEDIVKGYEITPGTLRDLDDEDFAKVPVITTRADRYRGSSSASTTSTPSTTRRPTTSSRTKSA